MTGFDCEVDPQQLTGLFGNQPLPQGVTFPDGGRVFRTLGDALAVFPRGRIFIHPGTYVENETVNGAELWTS